jgi:hypothetical protein
LFVKSVTTFYRSGLDCQRRGEETK